MRRAVLLALAFAGSAHGQGMGNGISKNTYTVSNPHEAYEWIATYMPVGCFDGECDTTGNVHEELLCYI